MAQTDTHNHRHTDGHGDSMTNSAQRGRVGENSTSGHLGHEQQQGCVERVASVHGVEWLRLAGRFRLAAFTVQTSKVNPLMAGRREINHLINNALAPRYLPSPELACCVLCKTG